MFDFFIFINSGEGPVTNTEEVKVKTSEAKRMLEVWKEQYFEVRAKIEASGRDQRWEFDRKKLFERTDHMAVICQNLYDVAQVSPFSMKYSKLSGVDSWNLSDFAKSYSRFMEKK